MKVDLLWSHPNASLIISKWAGLKDAWAKYMPFAKDAQWPMASGQMVADVYAVMCELEDGGIVDVPNVAMKSLFAECLKIRATGNATLLRAFHEQIVARAGAIAAAEISDPSEVEISDCKEVAKELSKQWIAAVKKDVSKFPHLKALQEACSRTLKRIRSDAGQEQPKSAAAGADEEKKNEVEASAATAEGPSDQPIEDVGGTQTEEQNVEEIEASAETPQGPKDQGGKLLEACAIVVMTAKKHKHLYNGFKAKSIRVNTHNVVLSILEGPAKGEKRKTLFATLDVVEDAPAKKAKIPQAPAKESVAPTAAAPAAEAPAEDEQPDNPCTAMFGDLDLYD